MYIYIYIYKCLYVYICMCVCVCTTLSSNSTFPFLSVPSIQQRTHLSLKRSYILDPRFSKKAKYTSRVRPCSSVDMCSLVKSEGKERSKEGGKEKKKGKKGRGKGRGELKHNERWGCKRRRLAYYTSRIDRV